MRRWRSGGGVGCALGDALGGGRGPRHEGTVVELGPVTGPLNGLRAAYVYYEFYVRYSTRGYGGSESMVYEDVGSASYGGPLLVRTASGLVLLPERTFEVRFPEPAEEGLPVDSPLPPELAHVMRHPALRRAPLCYRQHLLSADDAVELRARLEPARGPLRRGPYRAEGGPDCDFVARGERGRLSLVVDRSGAGSPHSER